MPEALVDTLYDEGVDRWYCILILKVTGGARVFGDRLKIERGRLVCSKVDVRRRSAQPPCVCRGKGEERGLIMMTVKVFIMVAQQVVNAINRFFQN